MSTNPSTPISLIWDENASVNDTGTIVRFPLNQGSGEQWYVWRGSPRTPLLVYDPEHRREIYSASQLFGHWTLGGKRQAALAALGAINAGDPRGNTAWKDGFEALATLDHNSDGVLTGRELEPLGLWFDESADAKSSRREVKTLAEMGITKLVVGPTRTDPLSGNVYVDGGFTRVSKGKELTGGMVDWFSIGASTQHEMVAKQRFLAYQRSDTDGSAGIAGNRHQPQSSTTDRVATTSISRRNFSVSSPINALWSWREESDPQSTRRGVLMLSERSDGTVGGMSLTELPVRGGSVQSMMHALYIMGKIESRSASKITFSIKSLSPGKGGKEGESLTSSTVELDIAKGLLRGTTKERLVTDRKNKQTLTYTWVADKK